LTITWKKTKQALSACELKALTHAAHYIIVRRFASVQFWSLLPLFSLKDHFITPNQLSD